MKNRINKAKLLWLSGFYGLSLVFVAACAQFSTTPGFTGASIVSVFHSYNGGQSILQYQVAQGSNIFAIVTGHAGGGTTAEQATANGSSVYDLKDYCSDVFCNRVAVVLTWTDSSRNVTIQNSYIVTTDANGNASISKTNPGTSYSTAQSAAASM